MYRAYLEFFEVAETKRRWNIFNDVLPVLRTLGTSRAELKAAMVQLSAGSIAAASALAGAK